MECFACNKEIGDKVVCPYCGYSFTATGYLCPNCDEGVCAITENMCMESDFNYCQVKQEAEKYSF